MSPTRAPKSPLLVIAHSIPVTPEAGGYYLDIKAIDGLKLFAEHWPGQIRVLMRIGPREAVTYGKLYTAAEVPAEIVPIRADLQDYSGLFEGADLVLASADNYEQLGIVDATQAPVVYIIEYTIQTRLQIVRLGTERALTKFKSTVWNLLTERKRRRAFRKAAAIQANGMPAYEAYRGITPDALLYFDSRVAASQMIPADKIAAKQEAISAGRPLRLAFSGRLERMKGADHLVGVAEHLARAGVPFTLDIFGSGVLRDTIAAQIAAAGLEAQVRLRGSVPFDAELVPALMDSVDLFLCCHRQADPSCTYLETLSCGVPIVGYDNAAFLGVAALGDIGVTVPMDDQAAMARAVATLHADRARVSAMVPMAAAIGRAHSFDETFRQRMRHLRTIAGLN